MAKANYALVTALSVSAALGGLLFGYDTAVISGAVDAINYNFIDPRHLAEGARNSLSGFTIGCALLGCVIGAGLAGPVSTGIGRKGGLMIAGLLFFVSSIGAGFPEFGWSVLGATGVNALPAFIFYRLMGGMAIGMASMLSPMYISEIAPPASRGLFVTIQQIAIVLGINLVYFVNWLIQTVGDHAWLMTWGWRYMLASAALPAALLFVCMLLGPETPRYLVLKDRDDEALNLLKRLMGDEAALPTLKEIETTLVQHTRPLLSFGWMVLIVGILLSAFQQFVGINAVLYYAPTMFENMGASTDAAFLQAVIVGITNTVFTLVALLTVDKLGRKPLLIIGAVIMAASMLTLGTLFDMHLVSTTVQHGAGAAASTGSSVIAVGAVVIYIAGFALSWGPVVWVMLSEIFPNSVKGKAMSIAVAAQWITNFLVSATFPMMDRSSWLNAVFNHGFAYWLYGAASIVAALFVMRFVPETKGRSLEAIQELWHRMPPAKKA
ncbi:MAG: sugar porter family MFS transporter [Rhizomicrobium sp.]|jgi:SP family xylose:H+ symportor-like MFS transporter